jgi:hypothetical protein
MFCIFSILLIAIFSVTAFADSVYFEMIEDYDGIIIELSNDGTFVIKDEIGGEATSLNTTIDDESAEEVIDYFKSIAKKEHEITYDANKTFYEYDSNGFLEKGYLLKICEGVKCKAYHSDELIVTQEELETSPIAEVIENEAKEIIYIIIGVLVMVFVVPGVAIVGFIILIAIVAKKSKIKIDDTREINNNPIQKTEIKITRNTKTQATIQNKSEKERYRRGDKSPFDV